MTVALGSTLSAILLQESVALAEGAAALALLVLAQFGVTYASVRSRRFADFVRSEPTLLARGGAFCRQAMRSERITEEEAQAAIRSSGARGVESVHSMILESDGTISVQLRPE